MKLAAIGLTGDVGPWIALGFEPDHDGRIGLGNGAIEFGWDAAGLSVDPVDARASTPAAVDGVPVRAGHTVPGGSHPNGAIELDHVVVMTDSIERTSAALDAGLGLIQRRIRETPDVRQAFHRFADEGTVRGCIVELVENRHAGTSSVWGLVVIVDDLDAVVAAAPGLVGGPKEAVQAGRRIASVGREAGLTTAVAFMDR